MYNRKQTVSWKTLGAILGACLAVGWCVVAGAQAPELAAAAPSAEAAWAPQAETVAQTLELSPEVTAKLVAAYKAARESQQAAMRARREQAPGGGRGGFEAMQEVNTAERAKLETALKEFLTPEQTAKALASLGTFNRRWDMMTLTLAGMNLDAKAMAEAMKTVAAFAAESGAAIQAASGAEGWAAAREKNQKLREQLDVDLAKILSAEQMAEWKAAMVRRGGGGRPGGPAAAGAAPKPEPEAK